MKIAKKKVRMQSPLVNPIIDLVRPLEKVVKKRKYIAIKCHTPLVIMTLDPMRSTSPTIEKDHLRSCLSGKTNYSRPCIAKASVQDLYSTGLLRDF